MLILLLACAADPALTCGPGTLRAGDACVPETPAVDDSGAPEPDDTAPDDTSADDTSPVDTAPGEDTGAVPPIEVYLLAGQSNMDGYAYQSGLPPAWKVAEPGVSIYWSGWGELRALAPASAGGSPYVGPEVSMGHTFLAEGRRVVLVKHAVSGTDLATFWYPGLYDGDPSAGEGWLGLVDTVRGATAALDAAGEPWRWAGMAWMQGESDAVYEWSASTYADNLALFVDRVREETGEAALPVAVGLIACDGLCVYVDTVRAAQEAVAAADPAVLTFETRDLPRNYFDPWHYDGPANRVLGQRFAQALMGAPLEPALTPALKVDGYAMDFDGSYTVGWTFTLDRAITVTDLGAFTPPGSFLWTDTEVGIWDADTEALLVRDDVPSRYQAPASYREGFWYAAIDPVSLPPGRYAIGLVAWQGDVDRYANACTVTAGAGLTLEAGAYHEGYWLAYPEQRVAFEDGGVSFLGPSFLYVEG
ncbi:MAG: hypothetical protein IPN01_06065 [Deltaproteobacteria bacterium]|nr:hypothetical protein [Deltaproteobacteria bacterium]